MNDTLSFTMAIIPILSIIIGLALLKKPAYIIIPFTLVITILIALIFKNFSLKLSALAIVEGTLFAIWPIIIVIVAGIFTYYMAEEENDMLIIKNVLSNVSSDKRIILLLVSWGFGTFLEGIAGYGVGMVIPLSILISMGFDPFKVALIALIMDTVPTAFGSVGIPITSLAQVTGIDVLELSFYVAKQLFIPVVIIPFVMVVMLEGSIKSLKGVFIITLLSGLSIAITQVIVSIYLGPELPVILAGLVCMLTIIFYAKFIMREEGERSIKISKRKIFLAWMPYILIVFLIILVSPLFKGIYSTLNNFKTTIQIYPHSSPLVFKWLTAPGVIIIFATSFCYLLRGVKPTKIFKIFNATLKKMALSSFIIICIVSISKILTFSNMILDLASGITYLTKSFYPFFSPLIGAIGTFVTGSDTVSNVLFGPLQVSIAQNLGVNEAWLAAANTTGATGGKMLSPQNIAIAATSASLVGSEGKFLNKTIPFACFYIIISGLIIIIMKP